MAFFRTLTSAVSGLAKRAAESALVSTVAEALGFEGLNQRRVVPTGNLTVIRQPGPASTMLGLEEAIDQMLPVRFQYTDFWVRRDGEVIGVRGLRVGNPHALFYGSNDLPYLHMYIDPQSASQSNTLRRRADATASERANGEMPGWRTFIVGRIRDLEVLEPVDAFGRRKKFKIAPGFNKAWYRSYALRAGDVSRRRATWAKE